MFRSQCLHLSFCLLISAGSSLAGIQTREPTASETTPAEQARYRDQVRALVPLLKSTDLAKVKSALAGLGKLDSPLPVPYVWQLFEVGEGHRRRLALQSLAGMKAVKAESKGRVRKNADRFFAASLSDPLLAVRRAAAEALAGCEGRDAAQRRYTQALGAKKAAGLSPLGRYRAIQAIAHVGGEGAAAQLRALLKDADPEVASSAAEGMVTLGSFDNVKFLIESLNVVKNKEVHPALVDALFQLTGKTYGANLLKWEQWLEEYAQGLIQPAQPADGSDESEYAPAYRDPYKKPVVESPLDFVVVFDTTGSLLHIWPEVSSAISAVMREMTDKTPSLRLGGVRYRADDGRRSLSYVIKPRPLTRNLQGGQDFILDASFGGGSGGLHRGLQHAVSALKWRANARKVVLVVGDTTPSQDGLQRSIGMIKEGWELDRIQFNALFIRSIHGSRHKSTYRFLAEAGGGRFYEYNKAWSHLVDLSAVKPDPKVAELPQETMVKWLTPRDGK